MEDRGQEYWEEIDAYLLDRLSAGEKAAFEAKVEADSQLAKDVSLQRKMLKGMVAHEDKKEFLNILNKVDTGFTTGKLENIDQKKATSLKVISRRRYGAIMGIAASLAVLLVAAWWLLANDKDYDAIASQNFQWSGDLVSSQLSSSGMAGTDQIEAIDKLKVAIQNLEKKQFTEAEQSLRALQPEFERGTYPALVVEFYLAQIELNKGNTRQAMELLEPLSKQQGISLLPHVYYYQALAHLKEGNIQAAKASLNNIPQNHQLASSKEKLLREID